MKSTAAKRVPRLARILIVDEHPLIRLGLSHLFASSTDLEVSAEATSAAQAIASIERRTPSLVLTEIALPGRSGLDLAKELQTRFPSLPVVLHSSLPETLYADRAIAVGVRGYVAKSEPSKTLLTALRTVLAGRSWFQSPDGTKTRSGSRSAPPTTPLSTLTDREFEVFRLVGLGCNTADIASQLHISIKTVDAHREHVKRKLKLSSGTALNLLAIRWVTSQ